MKRLWLVLGMALASGGGAAYLAAGYLQPAPASAARAEPPGNRVAVAARDLPAGAIVGAQDVRLVQWPADALPAGYARTAAEVVGRGLVTPLRANEPLMEGKLAPRDAGGGLPILIPEGMRAVSVRVDEVIGVAGFVTPGTRVDVLATLPAGTGRTAGTRLVLQNVQVLAAGQSIAREMDGKPQTAAVITLLVLPEQAEIVTLASAEGRIQLALRNTLDGAQVSTGGARTSALLGPAAAPRKEAERPRTRPAAALPRARTGPSVEIYRGSERSVATF
ncbi:MAG: Flp pilus assembly protein RcpC/CpaB [uncultured Gemmatimonadetes bacterium]|uniref:Flp pilus assembly protein RcpC/CpaB n=1 Tax=uncultured Gemmatimonadota bacterium TaxID=203437 RepID=A0A6J4KY64_9BACT|nr:MAG: Flp pilus assembly protein RcpC/CpaB [uncultured Gemmatimonadota bacterium]